MGVVRFTNEYSDNEIQKMSNILTLEKIGLSSDLICTFLNGNEVKKIDILNQQRLILLDDVHLKYQQVDCIDHLLYQLKKERGLQHGKN